MTSTAGPAWVHLASAGTSLLLYADESGRLTAPHWGASLGDLTDETVAAVARARRRQRTHSGVDEPKAVDLLPQTQSGYTGRPAIAGFGLGGRRATPYFRAWRLDPGDASVTASSEDGEAGLQVECTIRLDPYGVLLLDVAVTNTAGTPYSLSWLTPSLPVPAYAEELLDLTGRWCRERVPQRHPLPQGAWVRESRHGRTGHDATLLLVAGRPGFGFRTGEVWGVHTVWSGDHVSYAESTPEGESRLGAGELLSPGEVVLEPGASYAAPTLVAVWSDRGLDGLSERLHGHVRSWPHLAGLRRPVVLNTWEAVYFDHDLDRLSRLAERAAQVGVERFVLDDGWFTGRTDDRRGLGDWTVDPTRWPEGLHPLIDVVKQHGMDFGLWVEPEMVNEDSALARAHPDWLLRGRSTLPLDWRHQQVLDLQHDAAYEHVRDALLALLAEYDIAFLKWDHNRDLLDAAHGGVPAVHGQTLAVYRLLDELRAAHPDLEIESCASGGGRVDLGILRRAHRVWASDTNDAVERLPIQRWTSLLLPPELVGSHIAAPVAHTTGRAVPLAFRCAASVLNHAGVEWNLLDATDDEVAELRAWVRLHKQLRPLIGSGRLVRVDHPDPSLMVDGIVGPDGSEAWFRLAQLAPARTTEPTPVRFPGLHPERGYVVSREDPGGISAAALSPWALDEEPLTLPGRLLGTAGVQPPVLPSMTARVLRLVAE